MSKPNEMAGMPAEYLALCPLDGRYRKAVKELSAYFSEFALVKYRVRVEVEWLLKFISVLEEFHMIDLDKAPSDVQKSMIRAIAKDFDESDMTAVKEIEETTKHDVKSVEIFVGQALKDMGLEHLVPYVHIGCTSEDITNLAYAQMVDEALRKVWLPAASDLIKKLCSMASDYANISMLAHTHGQPATPTTVGKELSVYIHRLERIKAQITKLRILGKFNGATGNYSAIQFAYPSPNWQRFNGEFVDKSFGHIRFNPVTTQIESHDWTIELLDMLRHFNNVVHNLDVDMWLYISMEYFKQIPVKGEVGSSTMPHKVNPINFENSESNMESSNAICELLSRELCYSRMQRDLTDSSTFRNIGIAFGYSLQAIKQTLVGLNKCEVNKGKIQRVLDSHWEVLAEPIQTLLRKYGVPDAYNTLKEMTRGHEITQKDIKQFIETLDMLSDDDKFRLKNLTPATYIGEARTITARTVI